MTAIDVEVGKAYVVHIAGRAVGLRVGRCTGKAADGDVLIQLWAGGNRRWYPKSKRYSATDVRREATEREVAVGMPILPVPRAA